MSRFVLIPAFCQATGYTERAVRDNRQSGKWLCKGAGCETCAAVDQLTAAIRAEMEKAK